VSCAPTGRWFSEMSCLHQGFHTITSSYDHAAKMLVHFRVCDQCGQRLGDVSRLAYEPRFDPGGNGLPSAAAGGPGRRVELAR
jgi:hypothetical protein